MSMAYDRVEWPFLEGIMIRLGFSRCWVDKVMRCVSTVKYSFSLNGDLVGNVVPSRGMRQGTLFLPTYSSYVLTNYPLLFSHLNNVAYQWGSDSYFVPIYYSYVLCR